MVWGKAGSTTLGSAGDNIDSGTITASKCNQFLSHEIASGNTTAQFTFNGSTGNEYASRWSNNGGSENVYGTQSSFDGYLSSSTAYDIFNLIFNSSIVGEEKLSMMYTVDSGGSGAGNAPQRAQLVSKYVPSSLSTTITKIECDNTGSGSFDTGSNLTVLGSDITPAIVTPAIPAIPALMPSLPSGSVGGWVEVGRTTLGSANSNIDISSIPDKRYYMILTNTLGHSSAIDPSFRLNADSGSNYATRYSHNDGTDGTFTSQSLGRLGIGTLSQNPSLNVTYIANLSGKEKLLNSLMIDQNTAGASTAPNRTEVVNKWSNTSNPIDEFDVYTGSATTWTSGSECVVLGWDPTDSHTTNFWEELASVNATSGDNLSSGTFTAKKYLWVQAWVKYTGAGGTLEETFNNDTGSNYSSRDSYNGGTDGLSTSASNIDWDRGVTDNYYFVNQFIINNSANEKLCIGHQNRIDATGAGNAPIRSERVDKWANTSAQITEIDFDNSLGGIDISNAYLKVWGSN